MYFQYACAALLGLSSLVASGKRSYLDICKGRPRLTVILAPTNEALPPSSERGLKWRSRRSPLTIEQIVQETNIIIVEDNKAQLDALQALAEQEFAQLVQAQVALITQLEDVKNNIRINHFKSRFSQVVSQPRNTGFSHLPS